VIAQVILLLPVTLPIVTGGQFGDCPGPGC
jgi:hypothetical protein